MAQVLRKPATQDDRSSEQTAFDHSNYSSHVDWTHRSLIIDGRPVMLCSAEFQYFRVPDRERWLPLLADIKSMGFNAVRLYIHWGYHSSAEGVYNFRGNRDIDYLLSLCVKLELFVIVAPGPYICAEVQAGGFPIWLIAKKELRIRHMAFPPIGMVKKWDQRWHDYCEAYMRKIIPMLVPWERTHNPNGCIIALQIENELREKPMVGPGGFDDEIRLLCNIAREEGSTVPFFHNDDAPLGSWSAGNEYRSLSKLGGRTGVKAYRTDLYGFDLYFTFPPGDRSGDMSSLQVGMIEACGISACVNCCGVGGAGVGGSDTQCLTCLYEKGRRHAPPPSLGWSDANQMETAVDVLGNQLHKFGGSSRLAPPIVAEAQVGWINQWGRMRTYDDVYNFFGDDFSAALQNSLMAQGVTFVNHYIAYGGTNHGTVGDTEVYSSYDYSAFIREYGLLSGRGRVLRECMLFARSFSDLGFSNTALTTLASPKRSKATSAIKTTHDAALLAVREGVPMVDLTDPIAPPETPRLYAYLRNLRERNLRFNLIVHNVIVPCRLSKCESFVAPLYHNLPRTNLTIFACTVPVVCRALYHGSEMWVLRVRKEEVGRLIFRPDSSKSSGRQGVGVQWVNMSSSEGSPPAEITATDQDEGAAISLLSAPLEELPLSAQTGPPNPDGVPISVRTSTEEVGMCFTLSFSLTECCALSIRDLSEGAPSNPILRVLCLPDEDARTFSADLAGYDSFAVGPPTRSFSAAWGVSNLTFLPSGELSAGFMQRDHEKQLFLLRDERDADVVPEHFQSVAPAVRAILPGTYVHQVPRLALSTMLQQGVENGDPLSRNFEIPIEGWMSRAVHWDEDVLWRPISEEQLDPLDHFMTSGHVAYRLRFRSNARRLTLTLNVRHSAVIWCNGKAVGGQIVFSHNVMSAGAMHAVDIQYAGKKQFTLKNQLAAGPDADGFHSLVILVLSMGQSRSPFLLNDARNKRGLLSARLSSKRAVSDMSWEIAGVDVTRTDDAYGSSGLPLEDEANTASYDCGFESTGPPTVSANAGVVYYRGTFRVPSATVVDGTVRYPLRIKVLSGAKVRVMMWVNTLFLGRYVEELGPQTDFYVPEGLIKQYKDNSIVLAVYGPVDTNIHVKLVPWVVDGNSGNLDEAGGEVYALRMSTLSLGGEKGK